MSANRNDNHSQNYTLALADSFRQSSTFDIRDHLDQLIPYPKEKGKYFCPVCDGHNLSINARTGAYKCYNDCENADIREAISPWKDKFRNLPSQKNRRPRRKKRTPKPAPLPETIELARLPEPGKPPEINHKPFIPNWLSEQGIPDTATEQRFWYGKDKWVSRFQWENPEKPKGYAKTFRQGHYKPDGTTKWNKGKEAWLPYHAEELAHAKGKTVILVEGEGVVEALRSRGLVGLTLQGSNWTPTELESLVLQCKKAEVAALVISPDNDETGKGKGDKAAIAAAKHGLPCLLLPPQKLWAEMPEKGDIKDWIEANPQMTQQDFIRRLEEAIHSAAADRAALDTPEDDIIDFEEKRKSRKTPTASELADIIAEDYRGKLLWNAENRTWYRYEADFPGVWSPEIDEYIEAIIRDIINGMLEEPYTGYALISNTYKHLRCILIERRWKEREATDLLPFRNGCLEVSTGKLIPHAPGYRFTWSLPRDHNPLADDWGKINAFLDYATGGSEKMKMILLCFANAMLKGRSDIQRFLHLIGVGGSGKGSYFRLLCDLIGDENVHSSTLEDWCNNRFESANAYGKRLVAFWDEDKKVGNLGKFKSLTGGDKLRGEEKGKKAFSFKFTGMVAISSNFPIFAGDTSSGLSRRTCTVPFLRAPKPSERRDLNSEWQPELAAFTNYVLSIPDDVVRTTLLGIDQTVPESDLEFWRGRIRTDSIAAWLNDAVIRDCMTSTPVGADKFEEEPITLYGSYCQWCRQNGMSPKSSKNFSPDLLELCQSILGWEEIRKMTTNAGKRIEGLRLRKSSDSEILTHEDWLENEVRNQGDGSGDGSVTGEVTGQNPCPEPKVTGVTGKPSIAAKSEKIKNSPSIDRSQVSKKDNFEVSKEVDPSPLPEPKPDKTCDPSPDPSPTRHLTRHPYKEQNFVVSKQPFKPYYQHRTDFGKYPADDWRNNTEKSEHWITGDTSRALYKGEVYRVVERNWRDETVHLEGIEQPIAIDELSAPPSLDS